MLFDENYDRLIEILGNCDEDFLVDYQNFIAKFPQKVIAEASKGKDFDKKTPEGTYSYLTDSSLSKYAHNLSFLDKNTFSILKVCPSDVYFRELATNRVLSLSIGQTWEHSKVYTFSISAEKDKKYVKSILNKGVPSNKGNYVSKTRELTNEEFKFIMKTINRPFEIRNDINL